MSAGDSRYDDVVAPQSLTKLRAILLRYPAVRGALAAPRSLMRSRAVPYLAGSSRDGKCTYIDAELPGHLAGIPLDKYLEVHEATEWALWSVAQRERSLAAYRTYEPCHHLATAAEQFALVSDGYDWDEYRAALRKLYAPIEAEDLRNVPPDLALYPYSGGELKRLEAACAKAKFTQPEVHYTARSLRVSHCGVCSMFLPRTHACTEVAAKPLPIVPEGGCDKFEPRGEAEG